MQKSMPDNCITARWAADELEARVRELEKRKAQVLVALDGRCASGKTTLAELLRQRLSCEIVHMDDFFLRQEQRTKERLSVPGGNIDAERFLVEVMKPLREGKGVSYRPYDCHAGAFKEPVPLKKAKTVIVEGAYSCRPDFWEFYDLHVFLTVSPEVQKKRIVARNGEDAAKRFTERWIPLEEYYIQTYDIKERCELCYRLHG